MDLFRPPFQIRGVVTVCGWRVDDFPVFLAVDIIGVFARTYWTVPRSEKPTTRHVPLQAVPQKKWVATVYTEMIFQQT